MLIRRLQPSRLRPAGQEDLDRMRHDMLQLFDTLMGSEVQPRGVFPAMNVSQDSDNFYVRCELPGVKPDIAVVHRTLTVSGNRQTPEEEGVSYHRRERTSGSFSRSVVLPAALEADGMDAVYEHGVLTITLQECGSARSRRRPLICR